MKKLFLIIASILLQLQFVGLINAQDDATVLNKISCTGPLQFNFSLNNFFLDSVFDNKRNQYVHKIKAQSSSSLLSYSNPEIARFTASLLIPSTGNYHVKINSASTYEINNINLIPDKGNLYRNRHAESLDYVYGVSYLQDAFFPSVAASVSHTFKFRDFKGCVIEIFPFQYNPVLHKLRVYTDLSLELVCKDDCDGQKIPAPKIIDTEFDLINKDIFQNYEWVQPAYTPVNELGTMLVITPASYLQAIQPLMEWKLRSGIATEAVDVNQIGNNAVAIKTHIQNYYSTHPDLKYILLVGDAQDVATPILWGGAADPSYGYLNGNDSYAEVFVGRLSANNLAELQVQIEKIIAYEINPDTTKSYYGKGVVVGSNAGPGDDNEMDWEHARNLRNKLLAYTYTNVQELFDGTHPGGNDASGDPLAYDFYTELQNGISLATYTGHGTAGTFTTTGFTNNDISSLTNFDQWPYIWSVACANGDFMNGTCMAETFMRAEYNGKPTGAVATLMSSINQSWVPPMDAQDEFVDILTETDSNNIKRSFGGISANGCMHMNDNYGPAGDEMTDTWCLFGDPSLMVRTAPPFVIAATHTPAISISDQTLMLTCNKPDGIMACLSNNGQILDKQPIQNYQTQLNFNSIGNIDTLQLTIYGFNCKPYLADIYVLPASLNELNASAIDIYPIPAKDIINVGSYDAILAIELFSLQGQLLKTWNGLKNRENNVTVPIHDLSNGNYFLKVISSQNIIFKKLNIAR